MQNPSRRQFMYAASSAALLSLSTRPLTALAQAAPETIRLICGFGVGGGIDIVARRLSERLTGSYANSVVVDNRVGAGGRIAIETVKAAKPDGTVMLVTPGSMLYIYPHIYRQLRYDPIVDLTPITTVAVVPMAIAVGPMVPTTVKTLSEFMSWAKSNPSKAYFGSGGAGSMPHFVGAMIEQASGIKLTHVPYKGTQAAISDMMGGQISAATGPEADFMAHLESGRARLLATSGAQRSKFNPGVATFTEQGMPKLVVQEWFAVFMPPKTPQNIIQHAHSALTAAVRNKLTAESFSVLGFTGETTTPGELAEQLKKDLATWAPIVKSTGFTAD